jgi:transposase-like protein
MSLYDASQFLDEFGVNGGHVVIHEWVHKAELQPSSTVTANQLAIAEKMIRLHGKEFWLYGAVVPQTNEILYLPSGYLLVVFLGKGFNRAVGPDTPADEN